MSASEQRDDRVPSGERAPRSPSPSVKRPDPDVEQDTEMNLGATDPASQTNNPDSMDTSGSDDSSPAGNDAGSGSDNVYPTPSSMSTYTAPSASRNSTKSKSSVASADRPSYDDQVAKVTCLMQQPLQDKQKGYVVSMGWLKRVLARSATHGGTTDKTATEGEVGPVDNSDLVLVTDPAIAGLKDEAGEPFVPLRPGLQMSEDLEIVPQEAWDLIIEWYGLADQSPIIVRYAHNTSPVGAAENIQYEINPPIFTILKLPNPSTGTTPHALKDKSRKPARMLSSRHANAQKWLREAKGLANVNISTKVRIWRILGGLTSATGSAAITPAASRSASPAPTAAGASNAGSNLVIDSNMFLSLSEGAQREALELKDQTANENFNGKSSLDFVGLGASAVLVLEERVPGPNGGTWASEVSKHTLSRLGITNGTTTTTVKKETTSKVKNQSPPASGRTSPAPEPIRGRKKDGKPRGNTGLSNLGNTCYMNSALQCVRSVEELCHYFLNDKYKKDLNPSNPLAHNGEVAKAYATLLRTIYDESAPSSFAPRQLKNTIGRYGPAFSGYGQQDSQEFLLFLLDGLQEDLNRIQKKPYIEKPDSTDEMVHNKAALAGFADRCWEIYKARNDSVITDLFAGMYKSTLICPACDKVSIIFDPFNNLTLQLPIENVWNKNIYYFGVDKKPVLVDIEIDKNSSIKALKELVAKKMGSDPQKLIMSEIYKRKFYKMFDNLSSIAESQIGGNDDIGIFEVESVPTNYDPDKAPRGYYAFGRSDHEVIPSIDSPKAEKMLIPIFNRVEHRKSNGYKNSSWRLFGVPSYVVINRDEAYCYDSIIRKLLVKASTMTTRDFLNEEVPGEDSQQEDSDTVVMNDDDARSADSKIKTSSVDGEDGMVDVSMRDASDAGSQKVKHHSDDIESTIPSRFRELFEVKIMKGSNEAVPTGFSSLEDGKTCPKMAFRKTKPASVPKESEKANGSEGSGQESASSASDSSSDGLNADSRPATPKAPVQTRPFVCPGEGFVLDWTEEAYDALFSEDKDPRSVRGKATWANVERLQDPELAKRRQLRQTRKKRGVSLYECLDEFNKEEVLSENDAWYCPRCKEHRRASKKFELWKTPDILVMHLKRFSATRSFRDKLDLLVDFPVEGLDMTGRVECPEEGKSLIYDLFAVDNHYGGLGGGHYTAYAKNFMTGQWNEYNDSSVSRALDPQNVVTSSAYLLFYRRRSDRPLGGKVLEEITEASTRPASEAGSQNESRAQSPLGEGRRFGGSSRNGSSSGSAGAGAAHQSGGGSQDKKDQPPQYSHNPTAGETSLDGAHRQEGMDNEEAEFGDSTATHFPDPPFWSFDRISDAHYGPSQMTTTTTALPGSISDNDSRLGIEDDDDDEIASDCAVGGGDLSDHDFPLGSLTDSPFGAGSGCAGAPMDDFVQDLVPPPLDADDDDEEMPVVELRADDQS
ncbi:ubiquitin carbon terminal hydrolase [Aspergillus taichungensis]|uniref:ubiquitinyl hydrolase 1 n=1 Tax=Aspergillus taichungensis TaxID=482145 RepID=A0A2J5HWM1_9EURO|nr:ubiquitin carbon terminal hydrolase [Aspergillus taichungensis]